MPQLEGRAGKSCVPAFTTKRYKPDIHADLMATWLHVRTRAHILCQATSGSSPGDSASLRTGQFYPRIANRCGIAYPRVSNFPKELLG